MAADFKQNEWRAWLPIYCAWFLCFVASLGTLFFSEIMGFPPCTLCWYQRIGMYPLVAIFTLGILYGDRLCTRYAWPLALFGLGVAGFHNLLYYHLIPETISPCSKGVSCSERQIEWLGFISIPLLAFTAFLIIVGCLLMFRRKGGKV